MNKVKDVIAGIGSVWGIMLVVITFCGNLYVDSVVVHKDVVELKERMKVVSVQVVDVQKTQLELIRKMDTRITLMEERYKWDRGIHK